MIRNVRRFALVALILLPVVAVAAARFVIEQKIGTRKTAGNELAMEIGFGEVSIKTGTKELLEGRFELSDSALIPMIDYTVEDDYGLLEIVQENGDADHDEAAASYSFTLNGDAIYEAGIELGAGELKIAGVWTKLDDFSASVGAGELEVDLSGGWTRSIADLVFEVGIGGLTIILPRDIGIRVEAEVGLGEVKVEGLSPEEDDETGWTNSLWQQAEVNIEVKAEVGIGELTLKVTD